MSRPSTPASRYVRKALSKGATVKDVVRKLSTKKYKPKHIYSYVYGIKRSLTKKSPLNIVDTTSTDEAGFVKAIANIGLVKARETLNELEQTLLN